VSEGGRRKREIRRERVGGREVRERGRGGVCVCGGGVEGLSVKKSK
jgi:hypothetical protein